MGSGQRRSSNAKVTFANRNCYIEEHSMQMPPLVFAGYMTFKKGHLEGQGHTPQSRLIIFLKFSSLWNKVTDGVKVTVLQNLADFKEYMTLLKNALHPVRLVWI